MKFGIVGASAILLFGCGPAVPGAKTESARVPVAATLSVTSPRRGTAAADATPPLSGSDVHADAAPAENPGAAGPGDSTTGGGGSAPLELRGLRRVEAGSTVAPPDWTNTFASLYILVHTLDGKLCVVQEGAHLHTGERVEFHVRVGRPAYVHLIQVSGAGGANVLYPIAGEPELMDPSTEYRIPADPMASFQLDEEVGTERVAFVVTSKPLSESDADAREFVNRLRKSGPSPRGAERAVTPGRRSARSDGATRFDTHPGPEVGLGRMRGFVRTTGSSGRALDVAPDASGVAIATFTFQHIP